MRRKILVVDDEEAVELLIKEELEREGFIVRTARNGFEAIRMYEEGKLLCEGFDLVTLDIKMPMMDGIETFRRLREIDRGIPIILHTAYSEYKQDFTNFAFAADAYIIKSADMSDLKSTIRRLLGF